MAKTKISEYDATAANNTDIDSINIAEGMAPSNVNNAIRELMAHLKDMDAGTQALTSPQLTSTDINGGTIDGVTIGGSSAGAGTFTNLTATGTTTLAGVDITGTLTSDGLTVDTSGTAINITNGDGLTQLGKFVGEATDGFVIEGKTNNNLTLRTKANTAGEGIKFQDSAGDNMMFIDGTTGDISFYEDTGSTSKLTWDASAESLNFADNAKAMFGAGSDLQIWHDGNHSYIHDGGTGDLRIRGGNDIHIRTPDDENYIVCNQNDSVQLFYDGSSKLATSATGCDISGTLSSDGLTVSPSGTQQTLATIRANSGSGGGLVVQTDASDDGLIRGYDASGNIQLQFDTDGGDSYIAQGNVGIGTSSPTTLLELKSTTATVGLCITADNASQSDINLGDEDDVNIQRIRSDHTDNSLQFQTNNAERMRIDSSGNVGIGTTSPSKDLEVHSSNGGNAYISVKRDNATSTELTLGAENGNTVLSSVGAIPMAFYTNASERMRIDSSGNVLIGRTSATLGGGNGANLQIGSGSSGSGMTIHSGTASLGDIQFADGTSGPDSYRGLIRYDHNANYMSYWTNASEAMRIDSSGNVGIGTTSPAVKLHVDGGDIRTTNRYLAGSTGVSTPDYSFASDGSMGMYRVPGSLCFSTGGTERMRIDTSGNLLVGTTTILAAENNVEGISLAAGSYGGLLSVSRDGNRAATFNRKTSDGDIAEFRKDGTTVGSIGVEGGDLAIGNGDVGLQFINGTQAVRAFNMSTNSRVDDAVDLGMSSTRFDDIYATNGTIQTSDQNEKQDIEELTDAEQRVAVACKGLMRKFRWKSAVAEKGDDARIHFGIIAQDLQAAFAAEGLDAGDYAMFISSTWTDEETGEERTRLGVRYSELLAFIIAAI